MKGAFLHYYIIGIIVALKKEKKTTQITGLKDKVERNRVVIHGNKQDRSIAPITKSLQYFGGN